jgi:hypothetical protein
MQRVTHEHARINLGILDSGSAKRLRNKLQRFGDGSAVF